jgi:hypothetical protein
MEKVTKSLASSTTSSTKACHQISLREAIRSDAPDFQSANNLL